ncbi:hypothetical protein GH714_022236 [Hevea brasiliensis]|uniref:TORTIFOLIA1/SINE1-2 N-terminal domain-containing protein n=1 Tax=Hevea brasiliensis TaxID=3981 RepID=A0A6A6MCF8_HEVBR|nr:hypothetical protein GH714_022236 [Hevea brasiliensis]
MAQGLKLKVLTLITKLSDRDTYNLAATELESIAGTLDNASLPTFVSCLLSTDSTDKPLVRLECADWIRVVFGCCDRCGAGSRAWEVRGALVPKLERLLKSDGYKAKSAGLVVMGSVIGVGGVSGYAGMGGLVKSLVGFLSSEDWAARKAAAEALGRLAVVEKDAMAEFKSGCLKVLENRKFDKSAEKKTGPSLFRKVDCKRPLDWKVEVAIPNGTSSGFGDNDNAPERKLTKPETKRTPLGKNSDQKTLKFGCLKSGSRVVPCHEESPVSTVVASNVIENHHNNHKECEDLSLIRNQLVQIERQQSSLLDLLQRFIGTSQNGMRSLETRVHGLELALDEISYDLAISSGDDGFPQNHLLHATWC